MIENNMITTILFDLDGTLLPMDQDIFVQSYFRELTKKLIPLGYEPDKLIKTIWAGTAAMVQNNGACPNEDAFWNLFRQVYGEAALKDKPVFEEFYSVEFQKAADSCGFNSNSKKTVEELKKAGYRVVLATNPIFPAVATESRIRWAGLEPSDFELYTTYENSRYCKPNPAYYTEILQKIGCRPEECLMVGNDVTEDMVAQSLEMSVFLLTDCLINKEEKDISVYPHGGFEELQRYVQGFRS
ncbi:MAG: HAD family hydrolase [Lachnospiraceae bacterium]|nr:HAD family hydrolase [Lachnospiraceae bacterium]